LLTGEACFDDLLEWQLYNAASVGAGLDGCTYLYNNPLEASGEVKRVAWYDCPCCPSNLSRTWSNLRGYAFSTLPGVIRVRQYLSAAVSLELPEKVTLEMVSGLPWRGRVRTVVHCEQPVRFRLELRRPSWAGQCRLTLNGQPLDVETSADDTQAGETACGYDPHQAGWLSVERQWQDGDVLDMDMDARVRFYRQSERIKEYGGRVAVGYGPLIYCQEVVMDEPHEFAGSLERETIEPRFETDILDGTTILSGKDRAHRKVELIPYFLWGNRGGSKTKMFFELWE
jgi:uncharacterized protein